MDSATPTSTPSTAFVVVVAFAVSAVFAATAAATVATTTHAAARAAAAILQPILDCDETFNYLEPLHFLLYGHGLQTWEYAPQYALRSYLYLAIHALPLAALHPMLLQPRVALLVLRTALALLTLFAERRFARAASLALCDRPTRGNARSIERTILTVLALSPGMFSAAPAMLPSSFAMQCFMMAASAKGTTASITWVAFASLLGWPFALAAAVPWGLYTLRRVPRSFILGTICIAVALTTALVAVDSVFFGRLVFAPLNILLFNVFGGGSIHFGVDPPSLYAKNLSLNWTPLGLPLIAVGACLVLLGGRTRISFLRNATFAAGAAATSTKVGLFCIGALLMLLVLWLQPHKEERFLYPIYPMFAALIGFALQRTFAICTRPQHHLVAILVSASMVIFAVLRIAAVIIFYGAPMRLDVSALAADSESNYGSSIAKNSSLFVCLDRDWHRTTGHFTFPSFVRLAFVADGQNVQLPAPFPENTGSILTATRSTSHAEFNALNKLQLSRPPLAPKLCDYIVGIVEHTTHQRALACSPIINSEQSTMFQRTLYLPVSKPWTYYCLRGRTTIKDKAPSR